MNVNATEMMYVKVMTDEQLETLRKQIAVYATICEQLVEMHKTLSAHQDLTGARLGGLYCDPLMGSVGHKISSRQRWTPTPVQLQVLEQIFEAGTGTPSKEKIKEITAELTQHGPITETNVYNWFQNRRARSKRKQQGAAPSSVTVNTESEVETEVDSKDKNKPDQFISQPAENLCFQNPQQVCSELQYLNPESGCSLRHAGSYDHGPVFDGLLLNSSSEYNLFQPEGDFNIGLEG